MSRGHVEHRQSLSGASERGATPEGCLNKACKTADAERHMGRIAAGLA
jgi:hypothetical protein